MAISAKNQYRHPATAEEALELQQKLRSQIRLEPLQSSVTYLGGADLSFNLYEDDVYAGIIILQLPQLNPVLHAVARGTAGFPYIPGFLSFREIPSLLRVWEMLPVKPDALMVDGHGIAHPRRMGIATHFGLVTGCPTLGCAKKKLVGHYDEPADEKESRSPLVHQKETVGYAYRSKARTNPVFISPGHGMSMEDALTISRASLGKYRIPEPTRQAHNLVNSFRRGEIEEGVKWYQDPFTRP
jgi:deoxyribonuclease V